MYVLAFDTETTGLPTANGSLETQPWILQLAASLYDDNRRPVFEFSTLLRLPDNVYSHPKAFEAHGIPEALTRAAGVDATTAIGLLRFAAHRSDVVIGHNVEYDLKLLNFTEQRAGTSANIPRTKVRCTCDLATPIVNIPPTPKMVAAKRLGPKRASLSECYKFFFNEELSGAHDALVDTRGCARVYFEMLNRGMLGEA